MLSFSLTWTAAIEWHRGDPSKHPIEADEL
jgi:hypothetical protein